MLTAGMIILRNPLISSLAVLVVLAGCGGAGGGGGHSPTAISPMSYERYTTDHNGRSRVRASRVALNERSAMERIDKGQTPDGYRRLLDISESEFAASMTLEVIGKVSRDGTSLDRVIRITADQAPLLRGEEAADLSETGTYNFRGHTFSWVTVDGGPVLSGTHARGLENLTLDFRRGTASIDLRTDTGVHINLTANDLPFDIRSGAFGGAVDIRVHNPDTALETTIAGQLQGNVGGSPEFNNNLHGLTTSGIYSAVGDSNQGKVTVDGVFYGKDTNAW